MREIGRHSLILVFIHTYFKKLYMSFNNHLIVFLSSSLGTLALDYTSLYVRQPGIGSYN